MYFLAIFALFFGNIARSSESTPPPALFIFGDSLFDAGNNNYIATIADTQANYWPYGETFFGVPTGRATDGRTIPDFICEYAKSRLIPPYLQPGFRDFTSGVNFASIGAGALVETNQGSVIDLKTQLINFKNVEKWLRHKLGDAEANALLSSAVYLFSFGANDYLAALTTNSSLFQPRFPAKYVNMVIGNLTNTVQEIHKKGGRKFGFLALPALGCTPLIKAQLGPPKTEACVEEASALASLHNIEISRALQKLESRLEGFKYSKHDFYTSSIEILKDPAKYGFKEVNMACCGTGPYRGINSCGGKRSQSKEFDLCDNPSDFLFFDSFHPTEKAAEQFADLFWSGSSDVTGPYNLESLFKL